MSPVDGDPRPVTLRCMPTEPMFKFLRDEIDILGKCETVDVCFTLAAVRESKGFDKPTESGFVAWESNDVHKLF